MKVLLVNSGCLDRTGVCLFTYQWAHTLAVSFSGITTAVYFKRHIVDKSLQGAFEEDGVRIIAGNHSPGGTWTDKKNRDGIRRDLRDILKEGYDIVHIHSSVIGFTALVLNEAKRANVPVRVSHAHGEFDETSLKKILHNMLRAYIRKESTVYAGCSKQAGIYLYGPKGICSTRWKMVPNSIQTDHFKYDEIARVIHRNEIGLREEEMLLGAVGYLQKVKNHLFLIDVLAELKKKGVPSRLIILGSGILKADLESKIHTLGLKDNAILYGKTDDVPGWLSAMDIYLMPSLSEGLPISAVEAQASGLPCLLSDKISDDVDITSSVYHLSVDKGPDVWVRTIIELYTLINNSDNTNTRLRAAEIVTDAGFGISALKHEISRIYGIGIMDC